MLTRRTAGETLMEIARSYNVSFATIRDSGHEMEACIA
jgi:hypothetical protein